jgi:heme A synthase
METGLVHLHSALRWVVLVLLVAAIVRAFIGVRGPKPYAGLKKLALFTLISAHLQLVLGLVLYFLKGWNKQWSNPEMMKTTLLRFFTMEHLVMMLLAITLITMGYSGAKRMNDSKRQHKRIFTFFLIALILILASIPWPFRTALGAHNWI